MLLLDGRQVLSARTELSCNYIALIQCLVGLLLCLGLLELPDRNYVVILGLLLFVVLGINLLFGIGIALNVNVGNAFIETQVKMVYIGRHLVLLALRSIVMIARIKERLKMLGPLSLLLVS